MAVALENVETAAEINGRVVDRHAVELRPEIELVAASAAMEAAEEALG
jgi:hypothetical protein